jgi:hypothetical protein
MGAPSVIGSILQRTKAVRDPQGELERTVRPPPDHTSALKRQQIREFGYADRKLGDYEEDHLIPLVLGRAPDDARNLWPEPWVSADGWRVDRKDELEAVLARLVCAGRMPLLGAHWRWRLIGPPRAYLRPLPKPPVTRRRPA